MKKVRKDGTIVQDLAMQLSSGKIFPDKENSQCKGPRAEGCPAVIRAGYWSKVLTTRNEVETGGCRVGFGRRGFIGHRKDPG